MARFELPFRSAMYPFLGQPVAWSIAGVLTGALITMTAWRVDTWWHGLEYGAHSVWVVHGLNPLHIFLDVACIVGGALGYVLGMSAGRDREAAKALEDAAATEEWRRITTASPDGLLITDGRDRVLRVNPAAERVFGRRASELVGMGLDELIQNAHLLRPSTSVPVRTGLGADLGTCWKSLARHGSGAVVPVLVFRHDLSRDELGARCYRVRDVSL